MLPVPDTYLNKLPKADTDTFFVLKSVWLQDKVDIEIGDLKTQTEWTGSLSIGDLKESAEDLEIPFEDFYGSIKKALCTNGGQSDYEYAIEKDTLILRKVQPFKEVHCQVSLDHRPGLLEALLLGAIDTIDDLKNELSTKQLDYQTLDMEFKMLAQSYEKSVAEKVASENEMLKKCALLLNAKKNKIAELQQLLSEGRRLAAEGSSAGVSAQEEGGEDDDELTQPMNFAETQRSSLSLPKRKNLMAAEATSKRDRLLDPQGEAQGQLPPQGESSDSENAFNSEEMFNAMS